MNPTRMPVNVVRPVTASGIYARSSGKGLTFTPIIMRNADIKQKKSTILTLAETMCNRSDDMTENLIIV